MSIFKLLLVCNFIKTCMIVQNNNVSIILECYTKQFLDEDFLYSIFYEGPKTFRFVAITDSPTGRHMITRYTLYTI